jgi:hypothetical protein
MKKNKKQNNYFIFELLFLLLLFVIIVLLIHKNYKMTQQKTKEVFIVIEKSKKMKMNRCEYILRSSQGDTIIYNEEFDNYKLGDTIRF